MHWNLATLHQMISGKRASIEAAPSGLQDGPHPQIKKFQEPTNKFSVKWSFPQSKTRQDRNDVRKQTIQGTNCNDQNQINELIRTKTVQIPGELQVHFIYS
jgi:hypothetical protein